MADLPIGWVGTDPAGAWLGLALIGTVGGWVSTTTWLLKFFMSSSVSMVIC